MGKVVHIAILASAQGTNAENIICFTQERKNDFNTQCVLTDNPKAGVINRSQNHGVPVHIIPRTTKKLHEQAMVDILNEYTIDIICLAGFTRILSPFFLHHFNRVINIHPSFLPEFPGLLAFERAFESGQQYSGITVHYVDEGIDTGKIIIQEKFYRTKEDTLESFKNKGKTLEKKLYPRALMMLKETMG